MAERARLDLSGRGGGTVLLERFTLTELDAADFVVLQIDSHRLRRSAMFV